MNKNTTTRDGQDTGRELHRRRLDEPGLRRRRHVPADRRAGPVHPRRPHQLAPPRQRPDCWCAPTASAWSAPATATPCVLRAGESVWTPAGEEHFHGGTAENMMCHYAILDAAGDAEATTWLEPVTDEQYDAAQATD